MFIEGTLIFAIIPLASVGMMPEFVLAAMFILFVLATLMVTSRSHWAAGVVLVAVLLSPIGAFVHAEHPTVFTDRLSFSEHACSRSRP